MTFGEVAAANGNAVAFVMRNRSVLPLLLLALAACDPFGHEPPDHPPNPAPDLTIRQEPNDTVRVGQIVRFTAVFRDSLKGYEVTWHLADSLRAAKGRTVEWRAPLRSDNYYTQMNVYAGPTGGTTFLTFRTNVRP